MGRDGLDEDRGVDGSMAGQDSGWHGFGVPLGVRTCCDLN